MTPAMVAVGTYALLLAWNEYLYLFLLLSSQGNMTVPVALGQFLNSDEAPWNLMMATAVIYALPADRHLLRVPPPHERGPDDGRRERVGGLDWSPGERAGGACAGPIPGQDASRNACI